jgi:hypothetical protein
MTDPAFWKQSTKTLLDQLGVTEGGLTPSEVVARRPALAYVTEQHRIVLAG